MKLAIALVILTLVYIGSLLIFYHGIHALFFKNKSKLIKKIWLWIDIIISLILFTFLTINYIKIQQNPNFISFTKIFYSVTLFFLYFVPRLVYALLKSFRFITVKFLRFFNFQKKNFRIIKYVEFSIMLIVFLAMLQGIVIGKTDFQVRNEKIISPQLPKSFEGLKIVQISDIHIGSFCSDKSEMNKVVEIINELKPDLVFLTGDLVNNFAEEANGFDTVFLKINAPLGKYACLGNHDFGDYTVWRTSETKNTNLSDIISHYEKMGFELLRNEHDFIIKDNDSIAISGVDSWGLPPFKQYGDIMKAVQNIPPNTFNILLSHDPSYWNAVTKYLKNINITLSVHTHGMQIGLENIGIEWSPIKYRYPQWAGLYKYGEQYLYVNRGLGFIGFTGRIGMRPEITMIELNCK